MIAIHAQGLLGKNRLGQKITRVLFTISLLGLIAATVVMLAVHWVPLPKRLQARDSQVIEYSNGTAAHIFLAPDGRWRRRADLDSIDPQYLAALIQIEDKRFFRHYGVDFIAIGRAALQNSLGGRVVSGASTITMQLARLLEPKPRTLSSKLIEAFRAIQLEHHLSKESILEEYLRFLPFGRNYESLSIATEVIFGHGPKHLTENEIAILIAIPQAPSSRSPNTRNRNRLARGRNTIVSRLKPKAAKAEKRPIEPVPIRYRPLPKGAPHLATWLRQKTPFKTTIKTHLDRGLQEQLELRMASMQAHYNNKGIENGVAVIADHRLGHLKAAVGSFRFNTGDGSQIPGFAVRRSTGSTLKPFIYAIGLDEGQVIPSMVVPDVPRTYGAYQPVNFDGHFSGLVRIDDALKRSLNIPFIDLLNQLGTDRLREFLGHAGLQRFLDTRLAIGLTAALGGVELSPLELTQLYMSIPNGGRMTGLKIVKKPNHQMRSVKAYSRQSAYLTAVALKTDGRPELADGAQIKSISGPFHWKTGTSFGYRDAWAAGSTGRFTTVVWLGNYDRTPSRHLVGRTAAGPLLFDILSPLMDHTQRANSQPPGLESITVCAATGFPKHKGCMGDAKGIKISGVPLLKEDPYLRTRLVDQKTGRLANVTCRSPNALVEKAFFYPTNVLMPHLAARYLGLPRQPKLADGCSYGGNTDPVSIISPQRGSELLFIDGLGRDRQQVRFRAEYPDHDAKLDWFINGVHIASRQASEAVWWPPKRGQHEALVLAPNGRRYRRTLRVR